MENKNKPMKILIIEDEIEECQKLVNCAKKLNDIDIIGVTDSDIEGLKYVKSKHPEGIILDLELNNSQGGNISAIDFLNTIHNSTLNYSPIIFVTTHVNSKRTYDILHKKGVDLIIYKDQPNYSREFIFNKFLTYRENTTIYNTESINQKLHNIEINISNLIDHELDAIGISRKLKGRKYIHDGILFLIQNDDTDINIMQYLSKKHTKSQNTIVSGIQNSIIHAWRFSPIEDLKSLYTAKINYETGIPTPMEFIYYYADKISKLS